jgi:DNA modification methylase
MLELNKIYLGDCLDIMPKIADKSVDMVLCDLPYQILNKNNPNAQWDRIIPFEPLWEQYNRIIKDNGAIVLFAQGMFTAQLMMSNPKLWRYNLIWSKGRVTGFLNANRMPMRCHEDICVFYKSLPTYNPQMEKSEPHQRNHGKGNNESPTNRCYGNFVSTPTVISDEKFPKSIIEVKSEHKKGEFYHPTQKPVNLLRYLIRTYTNEDDVVLDNTMGSGSTIVAAIKENRQYIGIEKDEHYFEIANERIAAETSQLSLF